MVEQQDSSLQAAVEVSGEGGPVKFPVHLLVH